MISTFSIAPLMLTFDRSAGNVQFPDISLTVTTLLRLLLQLGHDIMYRFGKRDRPIGRKWRFFISLLRNNLLGKTVANIFARFFSKLNHIPCISGGVHRFCEKFTYSSRALQTDRWKSDLNSRA